MGIAHFHVGFCMSGLDPEEVSHNAYTSISSCRGGLHMPAVQPRFNPGQPLPVGLGKVLSETLENCCQSVQPALSQMQQGPNSAEGHVCSFLCIAWIS